MDFGGKYLDFGFRFEIDLRALKFSILDFGTTKRGNRGRDVYISQVLDFEYIKVFDFEFVPELSHTRAKRAAAKPRASGIFFGFLYHICQFVAKFSPTDNVLKMPMWAEKHAMITWCC